MTGAHTHDETTVLKIGGACLASDADHDALARYLREIAASGRRAIVVHGGNPQIKALHRDVGLATTRRQGLRVTSDQSMDLVTMALCGTVNTHLVAALNARGVRALGLSGADLGLMRAEFLDRAAYGRVGAAPAVDASRLRPLLEAGLVLVIAPVSLAPDGGLINVNADAAAHAIARALPAATLDFVSDVPGIELSEGLAARIRAAAIDGLIDSAQIRGGMVPKVRAAAEALEAGIGCVRIGNLESITGRTATEVTR